MSGPAHPRAGGRPLWVDIGLNLALLTLAASVLNAGVYAMITRAALSGAAGGLAAAAAEVVAGQLAVTPRDSWARVVDAHRRAAVESVTVFGPDGKAVAGDAAEATPEVRAAWASRAPMTVTDASGATALAPVGIGRPQGVVRVWVPRGAAGAPAWALLGVHAAFSAAVVAVFGFVRLRSGVLAPLDALRVGTVRIAAGEFGTSVPVDDAPAELAELGRALNTMSHALAGYRARTADQLASLEATNAELRRAQEALVRTEKLASVGRLAAGLAHELGNPLAAVRGYLELLALDAADRPEAERGVLERCRREVERMHALVRNLLDFARQGAHAFAPVDVPALLADAAESAHANPRFGGVAVALRASPGLTVTGDAVRLHQVFVNLLLNAAAAGARRVILDAQQEDAGVALTCADDGEGIPAANLDRLFEPFFTTRPPGEGTGLGLAIAHRIVEEHGGSIRVEGTRGGGATFRLVLPAGPVPPTPPA